MSGNTGTPFFSSFNSDAELDWQMSRAEKYCLIELLESLKPEISIEIGTYKGGSLQVIQKYSEKVYSIDISPAPKNFLKSRFPNVEFIVGEGDKEVSKIFEQVDKQNKKVEFVLIDGDHSKKGVFRDLTAVLSYPHKHALSILLHDSFNPQCRKGIKSIDFSKYPMVEYVELDYVTGSFWHNESYREMWGGFALIKLNPNKKASSVQINSSQKHLFNIAHLNSIHLIKDSLQFLIPVKKFIYDKIGKPHKSEIYYYADEEIHEEKSVVSENP